MNDDVEESYFTWLYAQVAPIGSRSKRRSYWDLFRHLHSREFVFWVPNDMNRASDGRELRYEFTEDADIDAPESWYHIPCSFLEMLIALSRRLAFQGDGKPEDWFWHVMDTLNLRECNDASRFHPAVVDEVIDRINWRTYGPDGRGGLFPLRIPRQDQTKVEIWYQLCAYVMENT